MKEVIHEAALVAMFIFTISMWCTIKTDYWDCSLILFLVALLITEITERR